MLYCKDSSTFASADLLYIRTQLNLIYAIVTIVSKVSKLESGFIDKFRSVRHIYEKSAENKVRGTNFTQFFWIESIVKHHI